MKVETESPKVIEARRTILELLMASGNHNCAAMASDGENWTDFQLRVMDETQSTDLCPAWGDCKLQELAFKYQVRTDRYIPFPSRHKLEDVNPMIVRDLSRCILCGACVKACNEVQVNKAINFGYRGTEAKIVTAGDRALADSDCVFLRGNASRPARWGR